LSTKTEIVTDAQFWSELRAGNKASFEQIYNAYVNVLYNFGNKICQEPQLVEDAIHDLFVDIWRYRENLSPVISIRLYLYASLRRRIIQQHTRNAGLLRYDLKWEKLNLVTLPEESRVVEKELHDEQLEKLKKYLNNLSPRQYEAIILRFYDEMSYSEIALIMEVNEQSVRNLIQRGLEHLRQYSRLVVSVSWLILLA
jgi:RNA polymerase sigma factor (sigma-70 family)